KARKLLLRDRFAEQDADTTAVLRAFHVDRGVADEPYLLAGRYAARRQCQMHRLAGRLVGSRIARPDDAAEEPRPAEPVDFAAQQGAGLVAHHPEKDILAEERAQHCLAPGQRGQPVEMDFPEAIEIDGPRFLPALAEMHGKALAQAQPYPRPRLGQGPGGLAHRTHDEVEGLVDRAPAVNERVVPIEQDRPRTCHYATVVRRD